MQEGMPQRVVRLVSPVNPMPLDAARPKGVGRKGTAALPKAAEVCELINPPSVPVSPPWRAAADIGPGASTVYQIISSRTKHPLRDPILMVIHSHLLWNVHD